jgi:hypothetical protein
MARSTFKGDGDRCDGKTFVRLPYVLLESPGYRRASSTARALLIDVAMQYKGHNNGKLVACAKYLKPKGWSSNGTVLRALHELQDCGLIFETRKGARPNKAAWFALTWRDLNQVVGLDIDPKLFRRGGYMTPEPVAPKARTESRTAKATAARKTAAFCKRATAQRKALKPSNGADGHLIAPSNGISTSILEPLHGAVGGALAACLTPSTGAYLETPSAVGLLGTACAVSIKKASADVEPGSMERRGLETGQTC